jgi:hypothetical protein
LNKATVPIVTRLAALQAAALVAPDGARLIAPVSHPSPLTALLREANETILSRALRFQSSNGTSLTLEVAGRRVLRLTEATGLDGAETCLAAPALEDEHKDDLIRLMQAIAIPMAELRVTSLPSAQGSDGLSVGLPVALLADLVLVDLNDVPVVPGADLAPTGRRPISRPLPEAEPVRPAPQAPVEPAAPPGATRSLARLARAMGPALVAWLIRGGDEDGAREGPDEMVSHLEGFLEEEAEAVRRQMDLVSNHPGSAICSVLGATLVEGHSVICARSGEGLLLGVIEGDATQALLAAWAEARA